MRWDLLLDKISCETVGIIILLTVSNFEARQQDVVSTSTFITQKYLKYKINNQNFDEYILCGLYKRLYNSISAITRHDYHGYINNIQDNTQNV